jgi:hypothetical protein
VARTIADLAGCGYRVHLPHSGSGGGEVNCFG